ncbi:hypothetical protein MMAN_57990 [Mycobacterium mantenii]|uniref:Uncharacterized protein n=1 Tax=Mycobacterium mantenii TaxID=560555 RepID=A0ABN6A2Y6_MYCNT|nr:hypothetical protein [Mycobacterium mantenii]MCV7243821.1 hypothetical protein [Mycobacterium mantenii]BBY35882.1 hypothetical protein MMAN_00160 [Mycobacterium mantenii]BBY41665.1 hypothetical protein MMAN_57990 [Mycobacterium mantenii]
MNLEADVNCPHCGWVIVCSHSGGMHHSGTGARDWSDFPWTENFVENLARAAAVDPEIYALSDGPTKRRADRIRAERDGTILTSGKTPAHHIAAPGTNPAYVAAAIRKELERLANAREGVRNHTLLAVACNVFEFVKAQHANEAPARAELERIATAVGLEAREIHATIESAWRRVGPRDVPAKTTRGAAS